MAEQITEQVTEQVIEPVTEQVTEQITESKTAEAVTSVKKTTAKKAAARKAKPKSSDPVYFVSADEFTVKYDIQVAGQLIRPYISDDGSRLIWECPPNLADRFRLHEHVRFGRVIEA